MSTNTIQFSEDAGRRRSLRSGDASDSPGIVFSRISSRGGRVPDNQISKSRSSMSAGEPDIETKASPVDHRAKQTFKGRNLLWLAYQSMGVIYGDIGTSPLYVYSSTFTSEPSKTDVVGILSLIIWSLLTMVTFKYVFIILRADNEGEGGTFSCYSLLSRYANLANIDPKEAHSLKIQRVLTGDLPRGNRSIRARIEKSAFFRGLLKTIGVLAVSLVIADGVLTPAQSVLGAYQGLNVITTVKTSTVVGATCGTLVLLFLMQPLGTTKIASTFAPIVVIWLGWIGGIGLFNLIKYDYTVLKAFNPGEAFSYLIRHKEEGWHSLGGVLLCFTGLEALFADLGAFSRHAIQISWLAWCLPLLLLTYSGQAAFISVHPEAYAYPVFHTAPKGTLVPTMILAVLAAVVASQAIITATFQLIAQITKLSYFPSIRVLHTSKVFHNQLYVPLANWLLMIGTVIVTAVYNNTTSLGNAYGVCVILVTFFDTCMVTLVAMIVWLLPWYVVAFPAVAIATLDGAFLSAAMTKVPLGAWFTLSLAAVLAIFFIIWRFGKEQQWAAEAADRAPLTRFAQADAEGVHRLMRHDNEPVSTNRGFGIFFDKIGDGSTPMVFSQFLEKLVTRPETTVFLHLRAVERPTVADDERFFVYDLPWTNCYRLMIRYGYMDEVITPDLASIVLEQIRQHLIERNESKHFNIAHKVSVQHNTPEIQLATAAAVNHKDQTDVTGDTDTASILASVDAAYAHRIVYVIGKEEMKVRTASPYWRSFLLSIFLFVRHNARSKMANLKVPIDKLVEIGFVKDI